MLNIILFYSNQPLLDPSKYIFAHNKYIEELLLEMILNSYKIEIILATYRRMRAKWKSWAGTCQVQHRVFKFCTSPHFYQAPPFRLSLFTVGSKCSTAQLSPLPPWILNFLLDQVVNSSGLLLVFSGLGLNMDFSTDEVWNLILFLPSYYLVHHFLRNFS